jgi:hypothetical protein
MQRRVDYEPSQFLDALRPTPQRLENLVYVLLSMFIKNVREDDEPNPEDDVTIPELVEQSVWKYGQLPSFADELTLSVTLALGNPPWNGRPDLLPRGLADELQKHVLSLWNLKALGSNTSRRREETVTETTFNWAWELLPGGRFQPYVIRIHDGQVEVDHSSRTWVSHISSKASVPGLC